MLPADMNKAFFFPSYKMHTLGIFGRLVFFSKTIKHLREGGTEVEWKKYVELFSEGGTGENQRINPHLNFGNFVENNNNIWKKMLQILT